MIDNSILLIDSHHGIYVPRIFGEDIIKGNYKAKNKDQFLHELGELGNPEKEGYFDAWDRISSNIILLDKYNNEYYVYQHDGNVWAIPSGEEIPEDLC